MTDQTLGAVLAELRRRAGDDALDGSARTASRLAADLLEASLKGLEERLAKHVTPNFDGIWRYALRTETQEPHDD